MRKELLAGLVLLAAVLVAAAGIAVPVLFWSEKVWNAKID